MKTFKIGNRDFTYPKESGVIIMKLKKRYYIHYSDFIAKTLLEWEHMVNVDPILREHGLPLKFVEKFLWEPNFARISNNRERRVLMDQAQRGFVNGIYFAYCEKYGTDKVTCSSHYYYGEQTFEKKTKWIDDRLNVFPYEELVGYCDESRRNTQ